MMTAIKMKTMIRHIVRRDKGVRDIEFMNPMREWVTGIMLAIVIMMVGGLISYAYYYRMTTLSEDIVVTPATLTVYDGVIIGTAIKQYEAKRKEYESIRASGQSALVVGSEPLVVPTVVEITAPAVVPVTTPTTTAEEITTEGELSPPSLEP